MWSERWLDMTKPITLLTRPTLSTYFHQHWHRLSRTTARKKAHYRHLWPLRHLTRVIKRLDLLPKRQRPRKDHSVNILKGQPLKVATNETCSPWNLRPLKLATLETCDPLWKLTTLLTIENNSSTFIVTLQLRVTGTSFCNSRNVFFFI